MNSDLILSILSLLVAGLSVSSLVTSIITVVTAKAKFEQRRQEALRILQKQLLELQAIQDSSDSKGFKHDDQNESEKTEQLINDLALQLKQYQEKFEKRA